VLRLQEEHVMRGTFRRLLLGALVLALPAEALATTLSQVGFTTNSGRFIIENNTIKLGTALQLTDFEDPTLLGYSVVVDDIKLTGTSTPVGPGVVNFAIDTSVTPKMRIFDLNGTLVLQADVNPGDFITVGASGTISSAIGNDVSNVTLPTGATNPGLVAIAGAAPLVDWNVALSAAGQNVAQRIQNGQLVFGTAAGTLTVIPEPGTVFMLGSALAGLAFVGRRRS
jgi:hypothetical protein